MAMWIDLILVPLKGLGPMIMWMDNCGSHKTDAIRQLFEFFGIYNPFYPRNMTAILQVLDLIVNGPIKTLTRHSNAKAHYESFKSFKTIWNFRTCCKIRNEIQSSLTIIKNSYKEFNSILCWRFQKESFKKSIQKTFLSTGTAPNEDGTFVEYSNNKLGSQGYMFSITPVGTQEPTIIVAEAPDSNDENINVENGIAKFLDWNNYVEEQSWDDDIIEEIETFDE